MEEGQRARRFSLVLTLDQAPPPAQRLREIVWAAAGSGCETLFLDWGRSYPWGFDAGLRSGISYREELVIGVTREAENRGMALVPVFPGADRMAFIVQIATFRGGFRTQGNVHLADFSTREGRSLARRLLEDLLALQPQTKRLLVNWFVGLGEEAEALREVFGASGLELLLRPVGVLNEVRLLGWLHISEIPGLEGIVLPAGFPATERSGDLVLLREYPVRSAGEPGEGTGDRAPGEGRGAEPSRSTIDALRALSRELVGAGELSLLLREQAALEYDRFSC